MKANNISFTLQNKDVLRPLGGNRNNMDLGI